MSTTTPTKSGSGALLAHTQQTSPLITVGSPIDVSGKLSFRYYVKMGRTVATALSNDVLFRLEGSPKTSGNDEWVPLRQWTSVNGKTTASSTTLNGATTAGNTTCVLTSATGITAGDWLYFKEATLANSEWSRVASVSGTTITFEEAQTRNHTNGIVVTDTAEGWSESIPILDLLRIRIVVDSASATSGQTVDVIAWYSTLDNVVTV